MGQVTNVLPTRLSAVKSALGTSSPNNLRAYLIGGSAGVTAGTAGHLGFIPTTGTLKLSQFRDATRANLSTGTSITGSATSIAYSGQGSTACVTVSFSSSGSLSVTPFITGEGEINSSTHANQWLIRTGSSCLSNTCGNWEIKLTKTGGSAAASITNNNTWVPLSTGRTAQVTASTFGEQTLSYSLLANVQIRRADTLAVVMQTNMDISAISTSSTDAPP